MSSGELIVLNIMSILLAYLICRVPISYLLIKSSHNATEKVK